MKIGSLDNPRTPQKSKKFQKKLQLIFWFFRCFRTSVTKNIFLKFLVENLQYTKNLEIFSLPGCLSMNDAHLYLLWILHTLRDSFEIW